MTQPELNTAQVGQDLPPGRHFVFVYPQIKKLTGAQRLILALAGSVVALPAEPSNRVTLLTHHFAPECRPALSHKVQLVESGANLNLSGNHYLDSLLEYGAVPALLKRLPEDTDALCFFGPPSLPGLWWAKRIRRLKVPLLYFCFEPPRAAYTDRAEVSRRMGKAGLLIRPLFRLYRPIDKYLARQAEMVLVNGEFGQQLIRETYNLPSIIITHGVDLPALENREAAIARLRQRYNLGDRPLVLTVNHLHPRKRVDLFLRAIALVVKEQPEATALIVGVGPEEASLKLLAKELGLNERQAIFTGFVPEQDLAACYAAAQIYGHTCRDESFGLAVLEASAAGLPVVAVDEGGPREIIVPGQTGFLVAAEPAALAGKISWLLANAAEARTMGERGAKRSGKRYSWERGAQALVDGLKWRQ